MILKKKPRVAILWHGDREARDTMTAEKNRFQKIFVEFERYDISAEPAVYNDLFVDEVRHQLRDVDGVLVWVNPVQDETNRTVLDDMLREVASYGVFVSTHPDVIVKMGTKEVLFQTRAMGWGGDIHLYRNQEELHQQLPIRLAHGASRVLKQNRGNNGIGVWRVEVIDKSRAQEPDPVVRVLHALRDSTEKQMLLSEFMNLCDTYFAASGHIIDQPFHSPMPHGMVRCYVSQNEVVGFGHQYVTALLRPEGSSEPLQPQPRIYFAESQPEFQTLRRTMETEWIPQLQKLLTIETKALPVIWDADFLFGPKTATGEDTYLLCEINVSSVYPFPDSALPKLVQAAIASIKNRQK
ncbi:hypothetical protein KDH_11280 [Dictyobacter sp. S3.2.2.5]|uniref:DUF6815 domain-containing protein n=1 Tax=Dictyobacter halimunensis TaxID=3026934 RepID=A0ABQ6FJD9_9CHLR|nr:hypothetical protein KDH_11280 [Dictyobacter sp. S3.2.2.5]